MKKIIVIVLLVIAIFSLTILTPSAAGIGGTPPNPYNIWGDRTNFPYAFMYADINPESPTAGHQFLVLCSSKPFAFGNMLTFNSSGNDVEYLLYDRYYKLSESDSHDYWHFEAIGENTLSLVTTHIRMLWSSHDIDLSIGTISGTFFFASDGYQYEDNGPIGPESPPSEEEDDDSGFLESIKNFVSTISDNILNLPKAISDLIKDTLKEIFVPDTDYVQNAISSFSEDLRNKLNMDISAFENLFSDSKSVEDIYADYEISGVGTMKLKFFDSYYLIQGVGYFRPIIRGFIVLLLLLYNVNQLIGFFGYNAGVVTGRNDHIKSAKEKQGE